MPFLEVLTRCYKRPVMLAANRASLDGQTDGDWMQTLLIDTIGRGIGWSYDNLAAQAGDLEGVYIWVLDDDDMCTRSTLVAELKQIVAQHDPDVIMLRMDHGPLGVLPSRSWGGAPEQGDIGCSAYVVRREVWQRHAQAMTPGHYAGDFDFIRSVFLAGPRVYWHDVTASAVQRISHGAPEHA